jgi:hypothetical protein
MEATPRSIDAIRLRFPFPGLHLDQARTDIRRHLMCGPPIIRSQAGRDTEDGDPANLSTQPLTCCICGPKTGGRTLRVGA